ncbi:MAG: nucleotidyl transferase AbiEii/AbiGii toxin family protein, partial [Phycisphaerales bacterium]|nr:nucleotidyl transferase AbiEii/AbiGii toxin family protein [Phycisphaerales bacterium]
PLGGARFPCEVTLAGRHYGRFHIDLGFGDVMTGEPERLTGEPLLEFAGIAPAVALAIPKAQQFAEKVHAYTFPWKDRINTRTKDLVDLVLLIERGGLPDAADLRRSLAATFRRRNTHSLPTDFPPPPESWATDYAAMASEAQLHSITLADGFPRVRDFWRDARLGL